MAKTDEKPSRASMMSNTGMLSSSTRNFGFEVDVEREDRVFLSNREAIFFDLPQVSWLRERVCSSLKLKAQTSWWRQLFNEEMISLVEKFLSNAIPLLVWYVSDDDDLCLSQSLSLSFSKPRKCLVFWLSSPVHPVLEADGSRTPILSHEDVHRFSSKVILSSFCSDYLKFTRVKLEAIFIPYLLSGKNNINWPKVIQQDAIRQAQKFTGMLQHFDGKTRGKVVLSLPPEIPVLRAEVTSSLRDKKRRAIHVYETAIIEWSRQIRSILTQTSGSKLDSLESGGVFPGASLELQFWLQRHDNLRGIVQQLSHSKVRHVILTLTKANSAYVNSFDVLMSELDTSLIEARSINLHLSTLKKPLERLERSSLFDIPGYLRPVFHLLSLVWHTSTHYTIDNLTILLKTISNTIVSRATEYLQTPGLFDSPPSVVVQKLRSGLCVAVLYKEIFHSYRADINSRHLKGWWIEEDVIFRRVDSIDFRMRDLINIFEIKIRFESLKTFEPGGDEGSDISRTMTWVNKEFEKQLLRWNNFSSEMLDPQSAAFEETYIDFNKKISSLDDRVAMVMTRSFRKCSISQTLRLLEATAFFSGQSISNKRETHFTEVVSELNREVKHFLHVFETQKSWWEAKLVSSDGNVPGSIPLAVNNTDVEKPVPDHLPLVTSLLFWVNSIIHRVRDPYQTLKRLQNVMTETRESRLLDSNIELLEEKLRAWKEAKLSVWKIHVTTLCFKLDIPLLRRLGGSGLLVVNIDRSLAQALEDAWAMQSIHDIHSLGHNITSVLHQREEFRIYVSKLEVVATQYNKIVESVIEVERPLIRRTLEHIHSILDDGLRELTWRSPRIAEFVAKISKAVSGLHGNLIYLKGNINAVAKIIRNWKNIYKIIHFNEDESWEHRKKSILHHLTEMWQGEASSGLTEQERVARKWCRRWREKVSIRLRSLDDIIKQYKRIERLVESSRQTLGVDSQSPAWGAYLNHLNEIFVAGLTVAIKRSLTHLLNHLEVVRTVDVYGKLPENFVKYPKVLENQRLLNIKLYFKDNEVVFYPTLQKDDRQSIQYQVCVWCNTIFEIGRQLPRLDDPTNHYYGTLFEHPELKQIKDEILRLMLTTVQKLESVRMGFLKYSYLLYTDADVYVERFAEGEIKDLAMHCTTQLSDLNLESGELLEITSNSSSEEEEDFDDETSSQTGQQGNIGTEPQHHEKQIRKPTLSDFETEIIKYSNLAHEIEALPSEVSYGWVCLDTSSLKGELVRLASEWRIRFLSYQRRKLIRCLDYFKSFIHRVESGIHFRSMNDVQSYDSLVVVMKHLVRFTSKSEKFDRMFEPAKSVVTLLKKHDIHLPQSVLSYVENAPVLWRDLKKQCFTVNETLTVRQNEEIGKIRALEIWFESNSAKFYQETFRNKEPVTLDINPREAYKTLKELHIVVVHLEDQLRELRAKQKLFQLMPSTGRAVRNCRADLKLLKYMWDGVALVQYQLNTWNHLSCSQVDIGDMESRVVILLDVIRNLDKRVRRWEVYHQIEDRTKNFLTSLPLIHSLRTPSMRPTHWQDLMNKTGVHFSFKNLTIDNLISLSLYKYPEEVANIVGKAVKQGEIEAQLADLEYIWRGVSLVFDDKTDVEYSLFKVSPEVQVTIEEHQLLLQTLCQNKFVSEYAEEVQKWQKKLATVEVVLTSLTEAQHTWRYLQPIYMRSDDIKLQLPRETQLFLEVDTQVKSLIREAHKNPLIIPLCCNEGREVSLLSLQTQLAQCERELEGYMDQKRKSFPRFYFVSTPHLLEILSTAGKDPQSVMSHIPLVLQSISRFVFDGNTAVTTISKGGEQFDLISGVSCSGRIEQWLQSCVDDIVNTIFVLIEQAISSFSSTSRKHWLHTTITQVALVVTHIHFSIDIPIAFRGMEDGNESAMKEQHRRYEGLVKELLEIIPSVSSNIKRRRLINITTQAIHHTEIIETLISSKTDNKNSFTWQRQLRHRLDDKTRGVFTDICDCQISYSGEYHGDSIRLVVTPLTERVFITLTQALQLRIGGILSGPPGTGKTETIKDLSKHLGRTCYVFNCSDQMTIRTLESVFKGLTAAGVWGCFDELNRVKLGVLSVVAQQFKRIFEALREGKQDHIIGKDEVALLPSVGIFITLNPASIGRTELPCNLKLLFRPVVVAYPDVAIISEGLLLAEGYSDTKVLSNKLISLFDMCSSILSKQIHYDWGLRAIRSLLTMAGECRRSMPSEISDSEVLLQVVREYKIPMLVPEDIEVFNNLCHDFFPCSQTISIKRQQSFDKNIKQSCQTAGLQPEEGLILKCYQLHDLLSVKRCIIIIGAAACGKTTCRKALLKSYKIRDSANQIKHHEKTINPKAVTSSELFGTMKGSREWVDGLASGIMRSFTEQSVRNSVDFSWVIFDGEIDTGWVESMNSAMDDNRILTLASNDRIQLPDSMTLLFEVSHLTYSTPATVSSAGILFIPTTDAGWLPYLQSLFDRRQLSSTIIPLIDKYAQRCIDWTLTEGKTIIPLTEFQLIHQLCAYISVLLKEPSADNENTPSEVHNEREAEHWFIFACIWTFGGMLSTDDKYRIRFDRWWRSEWRGLKFPEVGTVFDYCLSPETRKLEKWSERIKRYKDNQLESVASPLQSRYVLSPATCVSQFFFDKFLEEKRPILMVGINGVGKSFFIQHRMQNLPESCSHQTVAFNYETTAKSLQQSLERKIERKMGRRWGPIRTKRLVWVLEDMSSCKVDEYGTQSPIELLRQQIEFGHWYERVRWQTTQVCDVQVVGTLNPTVGSYHLSSRLMHHFITMHVPTPSRETAAFIFSKLLSHSFGSNKQSSNTQRLQDKLIDATLDIFDKMKSVVQNSPQSATHGRCLVSLCQLSEIFEGVILGLPHLSKTSTLTEMVRLWLSEVHNTYSNRLCNEQDQSIASSVIRRVSELYFPSECLDINGPLLFASFYRTADTEGDSYVKIPSLNALTNLLVRKKQRYTSSDISSSSKSQQNCDQLEKMTIFEKSAEHVVRISRILCRPYGNLLLVGPPGIGKRSCAVLAGLLSKLHVVNMTCKSSDFPEEFRSLYSRGGVKGETIAFVIGESLLQDTQTLITISNFLETGECIELYDNETRNDTIRKVRPDVRASLMIDTPENCWAFFVARARKVLHAILCVQPGESLRVRCRRFPSIIGKTVQNYFRQLDITALEAVAREQLSLRGTGTGVCLTPDTCDPEVLSSIIKLLATCHSESLLLASTVYKQTGQVYHITCKTFTRFIDTYKSLLSSQFEKCDTSKSKLERCLSQLTKTSNDVMSLKQNINSKRNEEVEKRACVDELIRRLEQERDAVAAENRKAVTEAGRATELVALLEEKKKELESDQNKLEPILTSAQQALDRLDKDSLSELKSFKMPPSEVQCVLSCVIILLAPSGMARDRSWAAAQKYMQRVDVFLNDLRNLKKQSITETQIAQVKPYIASAEFSVDVITTKSIAAAGLCEWVLQLVKYFELYAFIQPKRELVADSELRYDEAQLKVTKIKTQVERLKVKQTELSQAVQDAQRDRDSVVGEGEGLNEKLQLSQRIITSLGPDKSRWESEVFELNCNRQSLLGDAVLAAATLSYASPFSSEFRNSLISSWGNVLSSLPVPHTEGGLDPLNMLTTKAETASWYNQNLPTDSVSVQNAAICMHVTNPVVIVDPQQRGLAWLMSLARGETRDKSRYQISNIDEQRPAIPTPPTTEKTAGRGRRVKMQEHPVKEINNKKYILTRQGPNLFDSLVKGIRNGYCVIVERVGTVLDPVLITAIERDLQTSPDDGSSQKKYLSLPPGGKLVECNPSFRLILQTLYKNPDIHCDVQVINFSVTKKGFEDHLLEVVVNKVRPDIEEQMEEQLYNINHCCIMISELEEKLITDFGDMKEGSVDRPLVEQLELIKSSVTELKLKVKNCTNVKQQIDEVRQQYLPVARRGSIMFFILSDLEKLQWLYQYSVDIFNVLFCKSLNQSPYSSLTEEAELPISEVTRELSSIVTLTLCKHVKRGLLDRHRFVFDMIVGISVLQDVDAVPNDQLRFFLLKEPQTVQPQSSEPCPVSCIQQDQWDSLRLLSKKIHQFSSLVGEIEKRGKRWKDWIASEKPEEERLPGDARYLSLFEKMLLIKVLRPDRVAAAGHNFVTELLGESFTATTPTTMTDVLREASSTHPVMYIISQGCDVLKNLETLAHKVGVSESAGSLQVIGMGPGQEQFTIDTLRQYSKQGGWVILSNLHLMGEWLYSFESVFEGAIGRPHKDFRLFMTVEPSDLPEQRVPQVIVQQSMKLLSDDPTPEIKSNMLRAWSCFSHEQLESGLKCIEHKRLLFALTYFHAAAICRNRFGNQGWSKRYAFGTNDLTICAQVLSSHLDVNTTTVPWVDVHYFIGEIIYGGHVSDKWDQRMLRTLLRNTLSSDVLQSGRITPGVTCPQGGTIQQYTHHIENNFPSENASQVFMHANSEIASLTSRGELLIDDMNILLCSSEDQINRDNTTDETTQSVEKENNNTIDSLALNTTVSSSQAIEPTQSDKNINDLFNNKNNNTNKTFNIIDLLYHQLPELFNLQDYHSQDSTPISVFVIQEMQLMNTLITTMRDSLNECLSGLRGQISISEPVEEVLSSLSKDSVPNRWRSVSYRSTLSLHHWFTDFLSRYNHLDVWAQHLQLPVAVWLSGLFYPASFLNTILQTSARKIGSALDTLRLTTDVVKKSKDDLAHVPREGAFIYGLYLEGAGWDASAGVLEAPTLKMLHPQLPIIHVKGTPVAAVSSNVNEYTCPVYRTSERGDTFVFSASFRITDPDPSSWILRGTCAVLQPDEYP